MIPDFYKEDPEENASEHAAVTDDLWFEIRSGLCLTGGGGGGGGGCIHS
jgi:hypothetical protein